MVDLNGHEAGNSGHSQGKPTAYRDSSTRRDAMLRKLARVLELLDLLQEGIEHLVVVFAGENVRLESHF